MSIADIKGDFLIIAKSVANDDEATPEAKAAVVRRVEGLLVDVNRTADALESIAHSLADLSQRPR
jgi:hypothetical protein